MLGLLFVIKAEIIRFNLGSEEPTGGVAAVSIPMQKETR